MVELREEDLEKVSSGNHGGGAMYIRCLYGCNKLYTVNTFCLPKARRKLTHDR